jgi:hypothetical protein
MEYAEQTKARPSVKPSHSEKASSVILAISFEDKEFVQKAFNYYLDKFEVTNEIEKYCETHGIDLTYLGSSKGEFYKTLSTRHNSFQQFIKLGVIDKKSGKDKYTNHLVIPQLNDSEIIGLKFIDIDDMTVIETPITSDVLQINNDSFKVTFSHRTYIIQGLVKSAHILKATVKFNSGESRHVDVINFYSAGNRKRLIQDLCQTFRFPYEDIKSDVQKLIDVCEKHQLKPKISERAKEVLSVIEGEFTSTEIRKVLMWSAMPVNRALKELLNHGKIEQISKRKPFKYCLINDNPIKTNDLCPK